MASAAQLVAIRDAGFDADLTVVDMPRLAQTARVYSDCIAGLPAAAGDAAAPVAVSLAGPRAQVDTVVAGTAASAMTGV